MYPAHRALTGSQSLVQELARNALPANSPTVSFDPRNGHGDGCGCSHCLGLADAPERPSATSRRDAGQPLLSPAVAAAVAAASTGEALGVGQTSNFDITFDFRFDTNGFFDDPARRDVLEVAAGIWESLILDEFADVAPGVPIRLFEPETGDLVEVESDETIDDLLIFVGSRNLNGPIAQGGPSGFGPIPADSDLIPRLEGPDFEPFAGSITFEPDNDWFFDPTPATADDIPADLDDFLSIALHEIGHVLGFGTSDAFDSLIGSDGTFTGQTTTAINNNEPIQIVDDNFHFPENLSFNGQETLMDPSLTVGTRTVPTPLDLGVLADIGYQIADISEDTTAPEVATEQTFIYTENQAAGFAIGTVIATDNVAATEFAIVGGDEAGSFAIDNTGQITLTAAGADAAANDFEVEPNSFALEITASDAAGNMSAATAVAILLTDDPADSSGPPTFTSPATIDVLENTTAIATLTADGTGTLTFSIVGGADGDAFAIDAASGLLSFQTAPDFEAPSDADGDNLFAVEVAVTDGINAPITQSLAVTVVNDPFEGDTEFTLDADGNGTAEALTDGLNLLRVLLGAPVQSIELGDGTPAGVTQGTVAEGLAAAEEALLLDTDNNGSVEPLTDGLNVLRVLLGAPVESIELGENTPAGVTQETVFANIEALS